MFMGWEVIGGSGCLNTISTSSSESGVARNSINVFLNNTQITRKDFIEIPLTTKNDAQIETILLTRSQNWIIFLDTSDEKFFVSRKIGVLTKFWSKKRFTNLIQCLVVATIHCSRLQNWSGLEKCAWKNFHLSIKVNSTYISLNYQITKSENGWYLKLATKSQISFSKGTNGRYILIVALLLFSGQTRCRKCLFFEITKDFSHDNEQQVGGNFFLLIK